MTHDEKVKRDVARQLAHGREVRRGLATGTPEERARRAAELLDGIPPAAASETVRVVIPNFKTVNELNAHEHWRRRQRRAKHQKTVVFVACIEQGVSGKLKGMFPCRVTFTRIAPGNGLDPGDGLPSSMKHVRDQVADLIGVDDRDRGYVWVYEQRRGKPKEYGVEILVQSLAGGGAGTKGEEL